MRGWGALPRTQLATLLRMRPRWSRVACGQGGGTLGTQDTAASAVRHQLRRHCLTRHLHRCRRSAAAPTRHRPAAGPLDWVDRYGDQPRKGSDILVQALEREGVDQLFAYPGGASMEIHQALTRSDRIQNILCRHEQVRPGGGSGAGVAAPLCSSAGSGRAWTGRAVLRVAAGFSSRCGRGLGGGKDARHQGVSLWQGGRLRCTCLWWSHLEREREERGWAGPGGMHVCAPGMPVPLEAEARVGGTAPAAAVAAALFSLSMGPGPPVDRPSRHGVVPPTRDRRHRPRTHVPGTCSWWLRACLLRLCWAPVLCWFRHYACACCVAAPTHVHPQGEIFAAEGYAKATGRVGVCIATSGPGATNLVTGLADAMMDSIPLVAITGQVRDRDRPARLPGLGI